MPSRRALLERLFADRKIRLHRSLLFDSSPEPFPRPVDPDKVEGMLLGLAVGDALGNTTESRTPAQRQALHGEIRNYLPDRWGMPSDDTQLAFWTLEQMVEHGKFDPQRTAERFAAGDIRGIGMTVRDFLENLESGLPWYDCGPESAGNGALMRIAPMLVPHLRSPSPGLWVDTALSAMMTHDDYASTAACLAWVDMLWRLLALRTPPDESWWVDRFVATAHDLEGRETKYRSNSPHYADYRGPLWRFVESAIAEARDEGLTAVQACNRWQSGAYLLESVPSALYILMRHGHDPQEAIVRAVNDTWDNDTVGAMVGSAVGALHGLRRLPERWIDGHSGCVDGDDEGRLLEILTASRAAFFD